MTLNRLSIPSPNYSSRGGAAVTTIVVHTAQGSTSIESLGAFFANPASGVSSHTGIDDKTNTVGEYVRRDGKAWTQGNANPWCVATELCAFAEWDTATWNTHPNMLANCAAWIAEEAAHYRIPIIKLSPADAQNPAVKGVCGHVDLGPAGGGHWDPGPSFPWDAVLALAGGVTPPPAPAPTPPPPAGAAPPWPGRYLQQPPIMHGSDVSTWQTQMSEVRGWPLIVDGAYGPDSERVCVDFQTEKGLAADGIVGPDTWAATWEAPIT
jgi:hypothetical protein